MITPDKVEDCEYAANVARDHVLKSFHSAGLSVERLVKDIKAGLKAKEVKASYDKDLGAFAYSKAMICWPARQKAIDQAIGILGIKAPDKTDITSGGQAIDFNSIPAAEREMLLESQKIMRAAINGKRRKGSKS
jgi:hypothetical protein